jgi:hypothetical protein
MSKLDELAVEVALGGGTAMVGTADVGGGARVLEVYAATRLGECGKHFRVDGVMSFMPFVCRRPEGHDGECGFDR